jgi:hypothetical protein
MDIHLSFCELDEGDNYVMSGCPRRVGDERWCFVVVSTIGLWVSTLREEGEVLHRGRNELPEKGVAP